jgi:hypothetical protein
MTRWSCDVLRDFLEYISYVLEYWDGILHHKFMVIMYDVLLNRYMKVEELFSRILLKDYMFLCNKPEE